MTAVGGPAAEAVHRAGVLMLAADRASRHHHRRHHAPGGVGSSLDHGLHVLGQFTQHALVVIIGGALLGWTVFLILRRVGLKWTWTLLGVPVAWAAFSVDRRAGVVLAGAVILATWEGAR